MTSHPVDLIIANLRTVFATVLALSLGEAYKQIIADTAATPEQKSIRWDSLLSMVSFLMLLIPFFEGMARFLDYAYSNAVRPPSYGGSLLIDIGAFTFEASLFFVMSRTLRLAQWRRFYFAAMGVLAVDTAWGAFTIAVRHIDAVTPWMWSNLICLVVLQPVIWGLSARPKLGAIIACALMCIRTIADYSTSWNFYFPK